MRSAAWSILAVAGVALIALRLRERLGMLWRQHRRRQDAVAALDQARATWRARAETAESEVRSVGDRLAEAERQNAQLRLELGRERQLNQDFVAIRVQLETLSANRSGPATTDKASILDQHLALLTKAQPGALVVTDVLNGKERSTFWSVLDWTRRKKLKLLPQVSMGEYLDPAPGAKDLRWTYNDRRIDFLVCDRHWRPVLAIEHHGGGHKLGPNWEKRDAIKARALTLAGVGLAITTDEDGLEAVAAKLDAEHAAVMSIAPSERRTSRRRRS